MDWKQLNDRDAAAVDACEGGAVLFGRDDQLAVVAKGKHRQRFLHAVTTQRLLEQAPNQLLWNTLCTSKGALKGAWQQLLFDKHDVLWTDRAAAPGLIDALLSYRVAERVKLSVDEELTQIEIIGSQALSVCQKVLGQALDPLVSDEPEALERVITVSHDDLQVTCWRLSLSTLDGHLSGLSLQLPRSALATIAGQFLTAGATAGCFAAREVLRIRSGQTRLSLDLVEGSTPLEMGIAQGVHLSKGCYLGHEALAMQSWRGQLRRHLCWLAPLNDAPLQSGEVMRAGARRAGWLGGGYVMPNGQRLGLGLVQRKYYEPDAEFQLQNGAQLRVIKTTVDGVWDS